MKKIMAVILTAAIIFGFAACSPSTVSYFGKDVLSITVASAPDLFEGETLNPADVQLRVVYDDHTEEMFTGAQLGMTRTDWKTGSSDSPFKMAKGENKFTVYYGVKTGTNETIVSKDSDIVIKTVELSELVIDGSAVTTLSSLTSLADADVAYSGVAELRRGEGGFANFDGAYAGVLDVGGLTANAADFDGTDTGQVDAAVTGADARCGEGAGAVDGDFRLCRTGRLCQEPPVAARLVLLRLSLPLTELGAI